jgi:uncharacterized protein (TIGR02453 family)
MVAVPTHFSPEALKFLRGLARNNSREWFEPRKPLFEREVKAPMLALITEITHAMEDFAPAHVRPAQKCMMRIYRDTRFSADKSPYKRQVAAWWSRNGLEKTSGGGYYLAVSAKQVVIAAGVYMPEREQLFAIRTHLLDHHAELRRLLQSKKMKSLMREFEGERLTRPPKGFPKDHAAMDLVLCRQWGISATLPAEAALKPTLLREVLQRFRAAAPVVELLNAPLVSRPAMKRKPLF